MTQEKQLYGYCPSCMKEQEDVRLCESCQKRRDKIYDRVHTEEDVQQELKKKINKL